MTISLYDATVPGYLQILDSTAGFLAKSRAHFEEAGVPLDDIVESRLIDDMHPLRFQVQQVAFHSLGSIEAVRAGELHFVHDRPSPDYAGLQALIDDTREQVRALTPDEIDALSGKDVKFNGRGIERVFTAEGFLLSFSLPNFHFHATTAFGILRVRGAPIGKLDFMGQPRLKG